jgi:hypothetical protein
MKYAIRSLILSLFLVTLFSCSKENAIDTTAPILSMITPLQNDTLTTKEIAIQFKATDNESLATETLSILDENNKILYSETKSIYGTSYSYTNSIEIGGTNQTKRLTIKIECSDKSSNTTTNTTRFLVKI